MSEASGEQDESGDLPDVVVTKGRGVSLIWLVPIVALAIGAYMAWDAFENRGVEIVITYPDAEWLEAGKTKIKYRSIEVGSVDEIHIDPDTNGALLHCTLDKEAGPHLTDGAMFWIEHPRVGGGQISGLGTLLSGAFIAMRAGDDDGKPVRKFAGLANPPVARDSDGGLRVKLHAAKGYSLAVGSLVYYMHQEVGTVEAVELAANGEGVAVQLYLPDEHAALVRQDSRFWNAGGIQISASLGKVDVNTQSLSSILSGGIAFDSPGRTNSPAAKTGASYWLHSDRDDIDDSLLQFGGLRIIVEAPHLGGVTVGDAVSYREMTVGMVISQELMPDSRWLRLHLNIQNRYRPLVRTNSVFWNASGISADLGLTGLHIHAESLQSLLSGGIAFATPSSPGHLVKEGSVFRLEPEVEDKWLKWDPVLWRGPPGSAPPEVKASAEKRKASPGPIARFFHHGGKSEEEAARDAEPQKDPSQHEAHNKKKHGLLSRWFH